MAQQHFRCPNCGTLDLITYRARDVDDPTAWPPICATPGCFEVRMERAPQPGDFTMDAKEPFQRFTISRDVYDKNPETGDVERFQRTEVIDSLHTMRRIESDSERRYRNGEGEPMRFRMLSQNISNKDVGSFGREGTIGEQSYSSGQAPQKKSNIDVKRHGTKKPTITIAKGAGQSPLKRQG